MKIPILTEDSTLRLTPDSWEAFCAEFKKLMSITVSQFRMVASKTKLDDGAEYRLGVYMLCFNTNGTWSLNIVDTKPNSSLLVTTFDGESISDDNGVDKWEAHEDYPLAEKRYRHAIDNGSLVASISLVIASTDYSPFYTTTEETLKVDPPLPLWRVRYYIEGASNLSYTTAYYRGKDSDDAKEVCRKKLLEDHGYVVSSFRSVDNWS